MKQALSLIGVSFLSVVSSLAADKKPNIILILADDMRASGMNFLGKEQAQSARGRYVSAEKVQELFAQLGIELCAGRKRIRAARSDKSISIYVNGGTVNITFNEKGGKA